MISGFKKSCLRLAEITKTLRMAAQRLGQTEGKIQIGEFISQIF